MIKNKNIHRCRNNNLNDITKNGSFINETESIYKFIIIQLKIL